MAEKLGFKYTDETYITRLGLRNAMGTSLIDGFWSQILAYRDEHREKCGLFGVGRSPFKVTKTQGTEARFASFEDKLSAYSNAASDLSLNPSAEKSFEKESHLSILNDSSKLLSINPGELTLKAMINGFYKNSSDEKENTIYRYSLALKGDSKTPSEDSLGEMRFALLGHDEVSSFYRTRDFTSLYTTSIVGRNYTYAPYGEIEGMMDGFFSFLSSSSYAPGMKAIMALYYLNYVKPFEENNELLAANFARAMLASSGISGASCLPLESLIVENARLKDVYLETQNQSDLTYFVLYCFERLSSWIDKALLRINELKKETVGEEFVAIPEDEQTKAYAEIENASPEKEEEKPEPSEKKAPEVPKLSEEEMKSFYESKGKSAIRSPSSSLSDKEVKETARYILETNPLIRKKQALFYASHCTLGRFYTIQDFKKSARCAYETARTSMDALAELGFYQKKQIKNKFVYTPINQGETK